MCNKTQIHVTQKHTNIVGWLQKAGKKYPSYNIYKSQLENFVVIWLYYCWWLQTDPQWMLKLTEAHCQPLDGTVEPRCQNSTGRLFCQHIWKNNISLHPKSNFTHLHFLQGLHMDATASAVFYEGQLEGVHQDDSSQAWGVSALHVVQKHLSFVRLVTDDRGDFSWKDTSMREHTHTPLLEYRQDK